jgi:hypothetical protein
MTRAELIAKERARNTAYSRAFWFIYCAALGLMFGWRSLSSSSTFLATLPPESPVGAVFVVILAISVLNQMSMARCPHCRKPLNGSVAIATDRCGRCGQIAIDDPRISSGN